MVLLHLHSAGTRYVYSGPQFNVKYFFYFSFFVFGRKRRVFLFSCYFSAEKIQCFFGTFSFSAENRNSVFGRPPVRMLFTSVFV